MQFEVKFDSHSMKHRGTASTLTVFTCINKTMVQPNNHAETRLFCKTLKCFNYVFMCTDQLCTYNVKVENSYSMVKIEKQCHG